MKLRKAPGLRCRVLEGFGGCISQAPGGWARVAHDIPALADFPAMDLPAGEAPAFPPLGWQQPAARSAVMALAGVGTWLQVTDRLDGMSEAGDL